MTLLPGLFCRLQQICATDPWVSSCGNGRAITSEYCCGKPWGKKFYTTKYFSSSHASYLLQGYEKGASMELLPNWPSLEQVQGSIDCWICWRKIIYYGTDLVLCAKLNNLTLGLGQPWGWQPLAMAEPQQRPNKYFGIKPKDLVQQNSMCVLTVASGFSNNSSWLIVV